MDRNEIAALLALMAARDGRTIGRVEIEAWHEDVGQWDFPTAREAVTRHNARTRDFMRPFDLTKLIREIRSERIDDVGPMIPNVDPDDAAAFNAETLALRQAAADGTLDADAYRAGGFTLTGAAPRRALSAGVADDPERVMSVIEAGVSLPRIPSARDVERARNAVETAAMERARAEQMSGLEKLMEAQA
jgi:hypothetical protein